MTIPKTTIKICIWNWI